MISLPLARRRTIEMFSITTQTFARDRAAKIPPRNSVSNEATRGRRVGWNEEKNEKSNDINLDGMLDLLYVVILRGTRKYLSIAAYRMTTPFKVAIIPRLIHNTMQ
jgi:hypothetical protein